jgi:hypothetical protein
MKKNAISHQLSLFGLKATDRMREQSAGQIMIDLIEIAYPPTDLEEESQ